MTLDASWFYAAMPLFRDAAPTELVDSRLIWAKAAVGWAKRCGQYEQAVALQTAVYLQSMGYPQYGYVPIFDTTKPYAQGQVVIHLGFIYIANTQISAGEFNTENWILINPFDSTKSYVVGEYTIYNGVIIRAIEAVEPGEYNETQWIAFRPISTTPATPADQRYDAVLVKHHVYDVESQWQVVDNDTDDTPAVPSFAKLLKQLKRNCCKGIITNAYVLSPNPDKADYVRDLNGWRGIHWRQ